MQIHGKKYSSLLKIRFYAYGFLRSRAASSSCLTVFPFSYLLHSDHFYNNDVLIVSMCLRSYLYLIG